MIDKCNIEMGNTILIDIDHQIGKGHTKDRDQGLLLLEETGRGERSQIVGRVPHAPLPGDKDRIRHHPPRN